MRRKQKPKLNKTLAPKKLDERREKVLAHSSPQRFQNTKRITLPAIKVRRRRRRFESQELSNTLKKTAQQIEYYNYQKLGFFQRLTQNLRKHPLIIFVECFSFFAIFGGISTYFFDVQEKQLARRSQSWEVISTPAPGRSGKGEALEILNSEALCVPFSAIFFSKPLCMVSRVSLSGIDLSAEYNGGAVDLAWINLPNADLTNSNLAGAQFNESQLAGTNFRYANVVDTIFVRSNLRGTDFSAARMTRTDLSATRLNWANLSEANLVEADLNGANLSSAILFRADLSGANLGTAIMTFADLFYANLTGAYLSGANLNYANLTDADLIIANLANAHLANANLTGANLIGANLSGANLSSVYLQRARLVGVWAYEGLPPHNAPPELMTAIAYRKPGEDWTDFVDRIMRDRPDLGWTGDLKDYAARWD